MFQFPGFASSTYVFSRGYSRSCGFPHSDIHGSKPVRGSPWLFAAYHVLHRLSAPRHPPNALKSLDRSHFSMPSYPARLQETKTHPSSRWQRDHRHWKDQLQRFASPPVAGPHYWVPLSGKGVRSSPPPPGPITCLKSTCPNHGTESQIPSSQCQRSRAANRRRPAKACICYGVARHSVFLAASGSCPFGTPRRS
jgi:hypothetical protein